jgi:TRAP-type C4-dicarboxylate transport system permease small subunit
VRHVEKAYAIWRTFQDRFLAYLAALLLFSCTLLALVEVVRRYVFGTSYEWQADAVIYFMLSGVFLYFGISQRRDEHLKVVLLLDVLDKAGPRAHRVADAIKLIALALSLVFLVAVVWWGIPEVVDSWRYETRTESLVFLMAPFLLALLVGFAFMAITVFFQLYRQFHKMRGRTVLEEPAGGGPPH